MNAISYEEGMLVRRALGLERSRAVCRNRVAVHSNGEVRYEVRLRGPDGRERSRTFRTRKAAENYERELLAQPAMMMP